MTLRQQLAFRYAIIVAVCLLLLAGLAYHEFVTEPWHRQQLGLPEVPEDWWGEYAEVFFYGMIPVILTVGWRLVRKTLTPIDDLARGVERVHADNLHEPLPFANAGDEVDRLTKVFNEMTARLNQSFQQVREFTLHASHEIKTPLTVMRAQLETALSQAGSPAPAQREWMESQLDEVQRLAKIVDTLTLLTKADAGLLTLEHAPVRLGDLMRENFEDATILAQPHGLQVSLSECDDLLVSGDRHRLRQLLLNLTDNAVKYNRPGGTITMTLRKNGDSAEIQITNTGEGIPPELQGRVFERFVRGDEAKSKAADGCGLGLAIVQWIVRAHGGTIQLSSDPGKATTAIIRLPLLAAEPAR